MRQTLQSLDSLLDYPRKLAHVLAAPLLDLTIRAYMAWIFFKSGLIKFETWQNNNFDSTVYLFEEIHPIPGIDPTFAAYGATVAEIILPIMLVLGLFGRFAAGGLLVMTMVIQYVVGGDFYIEQHNYWMMLLAIPLIRGPGLLSFDTLLRYFIWNGKKEANGTRQPRTSSFGETKLV